MMIAAHGDENVTDSSILISQKDSGEPIDSRHEPKTSTTGIGSGNPMYYPSNVTSLRSQGIGRGQSPRSVPSGVGERARAGGGDADARADAGADDGGGGGGGGGGRGGGGSSTAYAPDTPDTPVSWAHEGGVTEAEVFMETPSRGTASHGLQPSLAGRPSVTDVAGGEQRLEGYGPLPTIPDSARREWTLTTTKPSRNTSTGTGTGTNTDTITGTGTGTGTGTCTSTSTRANANVGGVAGGGLERVAWGAGLMPPRWVPDDETTVCAGCGKDFDWARRRHHCRACGRLYCYSCSRFRALLPRSFGTRDPQRLCQPCNARVAPLQEMLVGSVSNAVKENELPRGGLSSYLNKPISFTLGAEIRKAAYTVHNFTQEGVIQDRSIPQELLSRARGLAFLTVIKGGFIVAGRVGTGLVIAKTEDGMWSAPSAIATVGVGWGALIGGEITDFVLVLNTDSAVEAFSGRGQVSIGAELGVAVGPIGRTGAGNVSVAAEGLAHAYSYSHSRGLFAGLSLEGGVIMARSDVNRKFYGRQVSVRDLLAGNVAPPPAARPLYEALEMRESGSENQRLLLLSQGFRLG